MAAISSAAFQRGLEIIEEARRVLRLLENSAARYASLSLMASAAARRALAIHSKTRPACGRSRFKGLAGRKNAVARATKPPANPALKPPPPLLLSRAVMLPTLTAGSR